MKNTPFCISYNNASHLSFKREQNPNNNPHFGPLERKFVVVEYTFIQHFDEKIYTQKKISVLNLLKKKTLKL